MTAVLLTLLTGKGIAVPLVAFAFVGSAVFFVAARLTKHADAIADATGLGRIWIGSLLLAATTSLPEVATDISAARLGVPDIGVGDLMGSTLANMLILALLDLFYARRLLLQQAALDHALVGTLAIALTGIAAIAIASGGFGRIGPVGADTVAILLLYVFGMHAVYAQSQVQRPPPTQQMQLGESRRTLLRGGITGMALAAAALLALAPVLVVTAEAVALEGGLSQTFVGTALVGLTTSFPEIAASIVAVRMGAIDLAVGNVLGSNAFNMCILFGMDVAYPGAPVLASVSAEHARTALVGIAMLSFGVLGILARAQRRIAIIRVESLLIIVAYAGGIWLLAKGG